MKQSALNMLFKFPPLLILTHRSSYSWTRESLKGLPALTVFDLWPIKLLNPKASLFKNLKHNVCLLTQPHCLLFLVFHHTRPTTTLEGCGVPGSLSEPVTMTTLPVTCRTSAHSTSVQVLWGWGRAGPAHLLPSPSSSLEFFKGHCGFPLHKAPSVYSTHTGLHLCLFQAGWEGCVNYEPQYSENILTLCPSSPFCWVI